MLLEHEKEFWGRFSRTHKPGTCAGGDVCVVHNPSDHTMRTWPMVWRADWGMVERICEHGIGHYDPDQPGDKTHGCDGCCGDLDVIRKLVRNKMKTDFQLWKK